MASSPQPLPPLRGIPASSGSTYNPVAQQLPPTPPEFNWHYDEASSRSVQVHGVGVVFFLAVFSLLLFIALLFLYSRWACRYRHMAPSPAAATAAGGSSVGLSGGTGEPATREAVKKKGLTKEAIDKFPVVPVYGQGTAAAASGEEEQRQCSICLGGLTEVMKVLPVCGHGFHTECVDPWLRLHASCPLCRASLRLDPLQAV